MSNPYTGNVTLDSNLNTSLSLKTKSLFSGNTGAGAGPIAFDDNLVTYGESELTLNAKRKEIIDYIRLRLGDGIVDVELDKEHYDLAINQALIKYRQRAQNAEEESYAFLELQPEVQEYILPRETMTIRAVYRRGIGSVTGTTASQFEPFASGYLNTYMQAAGRVGGLLSYELFTGYQEVTMRMFGGYMNFTWNPTTKKITLIRKMPQTGYSYHRMTSLTSNGLSIGSTITIEVEDSWNDLSVGDIIAIRDCKIGGYDGNYYVLTVSDNLKTVTVSAVNPLVATSVTGNDLRLTKVYGNVTDAVKETVLLWVYNTKPDIMLFNDVHAFPWLQDYAYSFAKRIVGEAREKFASIAGPQGGTQLNGASLKAEAATEMVELEQQLKDYVDGSQPLTWVIG
jgi:hypothetical protein